MCVTKASRLIKQGGIYNMKNKNTGEIILYQPDNSIQLEVWVENETVCLSLNQIAELFDRDKSVISRHIKNIFNEGELFMDSVVAFFATTAAVGKKLFAFSKMEIKAADILKNI